MTRALFLLALLAAGCAGDPETKTVQRPARELGERLFHDEDLSSSSSNDFACATCHADTADDDALLAGHPLVNSANRADWYGGYEKQYLDAVNFCFVFFMRGQPIEPGDAYGDALYEYLVSISPEASSPSLPTTWTKNITLLSGGDPDAGRDVYASACRNCHGSKGSGSGRLSSAVTVLDGDLWEYYDEEFPGVNHRILVAEKVRHGQFFGIGGNMPPFPQERLSDEQLADILAYLDL